MEKPYIISAEFDLPSSPQNPLINTNQLEAVRASLDEDLRSMGKQPFWVPAVELSRGINRLTQQSSLPIVSLDEVYTSNPDLKLGISRGVNTQLKDAGYTNRSSRYKDIARQLDAVSVLGPEVQLIDDVVFSGDMIAWLADELAKRKVAIKRIIAGIAIKEGIGKAEALGIPLDAVRTFGAIDDELCERDLFIAKGSGRRVVRKETNALYFDDKNGKPETWASIPAAFTQRFCINSLERSLQLLKPDVPMRVVGNFYGYERSGGMAQDGIKQRLTNEIEEQ